MQDDPYNCGFEPGKFRTEYFGREQGWYVVIVFQCYEPGLEACMMDRDVFDWLFEEVGPANFLMQKTGTPVDKEYPKLRLCEGDGTNTALMFKRFADLVAFDQHFGVTGMKRLMEGR